MCLSKNEPLTERRRHSYTGPDWNIVELEGDEAFTLGVALSGIEAERSPELEVVRTRRLLGCPPAIVGARPSWNYAAVHLATQHRPRPGHQLLLWIWRRWMRPIRSAAANWVLEPLSIAPLTLQ